MLSKYQTAETVQRSDSVYQIGLHKDWQSRGLRNSHMHQVWNPLAEADIRVYCSGGRHDKGLDIYFPDFLGRKFIKILLETNGFSIFFNRLYLLGFPKAGWVDSGNPYDFVSTNLYERPKWMGVTEIIVGGSSVERHLLIIEAQDGSVIAAEDAPVKVVVAQWKSLDECIVTEVMRLNSLYRPDGTCIDEAKAAQLGFTF